jgi:hypothetical protein
MLLLPLSTIHLSQCAQHAAGKVPALINRLVSATLFVPLTLSDYMARETLVHLHSIDRLELLADDK